MTSKFLNQDLGSDEEDEEFNPAPANDEDDEDEQNNHGRGDDDEDEEEERVTSGRTNRNRASGPVADGGYRDDGGGGREDLVGDEDDDNEDDAREDEDDDDDENDDEDDEDAVRVSSKYSLWLPQKQPLPPFCRFIIEKRIFTNISLFCLFTNCRVALTSEGEEMASDISSKSKPALMRMMKRRMRKKMIWATALALRCILTI